MTLFINVPLLFLEKSLGPKITQINLNLYLKLPSLERVTLDLLSHDLQLFSDDPSSEKTLNPTLERIFDPMSEMESQIFFSSDFEEQV